MKKLTALALTVALAFAGSSAFAQETKKGKKGKGGAASSMQTSETAPKSVIHVVTVKFKDGTSQEQIQAALDGVKALPKAFPGITRVWTRSIKVQNPSDLPKEKRRTHAFVMEFASEQALKDYHNSPAQLDWYKSYEPIREQSTTHDITN